MLGCVIYSSLLGRPQKKPAEAGSVAPKELQILFLWVAHIGEAVAFALT
jgi:hypothetical protein